MSRDAWRWTLGGVALAAVVALAAQAPVLLRRIHAFDVDRVEVLGTQYLAPHEALEASGITRTSSVFDEFDPWVAALIRHPLIDSVRIERRLPSTIVVHVRETVPVALVRTPELRPVDAWSRVLPIDPAAADLDLPVVGVASDVHVDGRLANRLAVAMVDALVRIRRLEPGIAARVSEAAPAVTGGLRLAFRDPVGAEMLLPPTLEAERLAQLRLTIADLERRVELGAVRRIDVRFRDQIVVSLSPSQDS